MKILIVSQYFCPESFAINNLVKILSIQGNTVKVLTGKPNYPDGQIFDGYQANGCYEDVFSSDVSVFRAPLRPRRQGGAKNLIINYVSFVMNGLCYFPQAVRSESYDVIFAIGFSPITSVIPAILLKWRLKSHLALWVQDLWPESLKATGFLNNRLLLWLSGWLVRGIYFFSDTILVQSQAFFEPVMKYTNRNKIVYYPNSYSLEHVKNCESTEIPQEILEQLSSNFCLVFAGNLGRAQSLQTLVAAADRLRYLINFRLVVVGSGSMGEWLKLQKKQRKLDNIILAGRFPITEMSQFFSRSSGLIVTLNRDDIFTYTVPSKIQSYLAAGKPIVASLDGEGARIIEEAGAGLTCPAENVDELVACIEKLYSMSELERQKMGVAGRNYFLRNFEVEEKARRLIEIFNDRIKGKTDD